MRISLGMPRFQAALRGRPGIEAKIRQLSDHVDSELFPEIERNKTEDEEKDEETEDEEKDEETLGNEK